jgi:adenylate cyclase
LSLARYASRDYEGAADAARKSTGAVANFAFSYFNLAVACGQLGRSQEARQALQEGMRLHPDFSTEFIGALWPYKDAADFDHFVDGLRKAGMPE